MINRIAPLCAFAFVALGTAAMAQNFEMPMRKAGLWEISMKSDGPAGGRLMQQCTDATTDKELGGAFGGPEQQQLCTQQNMQKSGNSITIDSTCNIGGMKSTTHTVVSGDFNSAYTVTVTSKREGSVAPGAPPARDSTMVIEAKYAGPCTAGQRPGDIIMPGGIKMNIADMKKLRGMAPQGGMMAPPPRGGMMAPGGAMAPQK